LTGIVPRLRSGGVWVKVKLRTGRLKTGLRQVTTSFPGDKLSLLYPSSNHPQRALQRRQCCTARFENEARLLTKPRFPFWIGSEAVQNQRTMEGV